MISSRTVHRDSWVMPCCSRRAPISPVPAAPADWLAERVEDRVGGRADA